MDIRVIPQGKYFAILIGKGFYEVKPFVKVSQ